MSGKDNVDAIPEKSDTGGGGGDTIDARLAGYVVSYTLELAKISAVSRKLVRSGEIELWTFSSQDHSLPGGMTKYPTGPHRTTPGPATVKFEK